MRSQLGGLRRQFMENNLITTESRASNRVKSQEKEDNTIEWLTLFRRNWHIYAEMVLGVQLRPFQRVMLYLMGISPIFFAICSRGLSKSFLAGLAAIICMNLYPYSEVVITSSTVAQANKLADKKIRDEIIKKLSPYLLYMYEHEYIVITKPDDGTRIENKLNGSSIVVLPCTESSRGERATMLIYEEVRLLKKSILDAVFEKMPHPRQAKYLDNPVYGNDKRWIEECRRIYITSARYRFEWFFSTFKKTVTQHFLDKRITHNIFAGDIFMAIDNRLKTWADYRKGRQDSETDWRMEDLNEMIGESDDAFFNYQQFKEAQSLPIVFKPYKPLDLIMGNDLGNVPKMENEVRVIAADFAFTETKGNNESDFTQFVCMSAHWHKGKFERHIDYMETWQANDDDGAVQRLKELYWDYNADFLVVDVRNGGENLIIQFSKPLANEARGSEWICRGFGMANTPQYHVAAKDKIDYYRQRAIDRDYIPCIIPFVGTAANNTAYWRGMKRALDRHMFKMPISMQDKQTQLEDSGEYFKLTAEQLADELTPYGQGDMLIKEAVELTKEIRNDQIKLVEPRTGHKDRIVTAAMANMIIDLIEVEWNKQAQQDDYNLDEIELVW